VNALSFGKRVVALSGGVVVSTLLDSKRKFFVHYLQRRLVLEKRGQEEINTKKR
jgi:hypothetical protein